MQPYYLYTFESTHGAIASHKLLKDKMNAVIMPVLREINASCGMAVKVMPADYEKSLELMTRDMEGDFSLYFVDDGTITQLKKENK